MNVDDPRHQKMVNDLITLWGQYLQDGASIYNDPAARNSYATGKLIASIASVSMGDSSIELPLRKMVRVELAKKTPL